MIVGCLACGRGNSDLEPRCLGCGAPLPTASSDEPDPRIGTRLGRFVLERRLGAGGMAVVYEALDGDRRFAVKLIAPGLAGRADVRARLLREARLAGALEHPRIGAVHGIEDLAGELAIVMALYDGEPLSRRIARGALPVPDALAIATAVIEGLAAAHAAGVVHRDVKPGNVFLASDGGVKLLDFGLARSLDVETRSLTGDGALIGTLAYMAPEQLAGSDGDPRTDLWALGVMIYEMIAGFPPSSARAARWPGRRRARLSRVAADVPRYLDRLVAWLLEPDPEDRPVGAPDVLAALRDRRVPVRWPARLLLRRRAG